jgi:diguanylate cyclase (GGDEF)-like protein/PAS domain S-box-containing protein
MVLKVILILSIVIQFFTGFLAIRLIKKTGWRLSWIFIAGAFFFMGLRRILAYLNLGPEYLSEMSSLTFEVLGLVTSLLMLAGVFWIAPLFESIQSSRKAISDSEAKYRSLIESSDDSIYLIDRTYRYLFINKKHLERLGLNEDSYEGKAYGEFHAEEEIKEFVSHINSVFTKGVSLQHEHQSQRDNSFFLRTMSPVKDPNGDVLAVTVVSKNITKRKEMEEKLRSLSLSDELTGLYNRRGFITLSEERIKIANRLKNGIFVLYLDLDKLKEINDFMGHQTGDDALVQTAFILKETFRDSDIIARIGGDEFAVLMMDNFYEDSKTIIKRLEKKIQKYRKGLKYHLSLSMGIVHFVHNKMIPVDEALAKADILMYKNKKEKRKRKA